MNVEPSWYVERLFLVEDFIRRKMYSEEEPDQRYVDAYDDLILAEKTFNDLYTRGLVTLEDSDLLDKFRWGQTLTRFESRKVKDICGRVGYFLGGYFPDSGLVEYMRSKHNLSPDQVDTMVNFITSIHRLR